MVPRNCIHKKVSKTLSVLYQRRQQFWSVWNIDSRQECSLTQCLNDHLEISCAQSGECLASTEREVFKISLFVERLVREDVILAGPAEAVAQQNLPFLPSRRLFDGLLKGDHFGQEEPPFIVFVPILSATVAAPWYWRGGRPSATWPTIDCEEQWLFDFAQGKRVARKRKAVASENEEPGPSRLRVN